MDQHTYGRAPSAEVREEQWRRLELNLLLICALFSLGVEAVDKDVISLPPRKAKVSASVPVLVYVCIYECMYVCMYVYIYVYISYSLRVHLHARLCV